jgi:hypothetical protein
MIVVHAVSVVLEVATAYAWPQRLSLETTRASRPDSAALALSSQTAAAGIEPPLSVLRQASSRNTGAGDGAAQSCGLNTGAAN